MSQQQDVADAANADASLWNNLNFLRLLFGRFVTNAGDSLYTIAGTWLVYSLAGYLVFRVFAQVARRRGVMGHY